MSGFSVLSPSIHTSQPTVAALESLESAALKDGELGYVKANNIYYYLDLTSVQPRTGTTVLYTRNSNPQFGGLPAGATPGRWIERF